jgi:gluconate 2-dehydrogenase gamma chain
MLVATLGGASAAALAAACTREAPAEQNATSSSSTAAPAAGDTAVEQAFVPVLAALAARLLPSDDLGPGAREAGVEGFLARVFDDERLSAVHPLLKRGCSFVMRAARATQGRAFTELTDAEQDEIIARLVDGQMRPDGFSGPLFVRIVLALTLEGFLGDPRHGGNKDGVGWRFVGFSPEGRAQGLAQPSPSAPSAPSALKVVP